MNVRKNGSKSTLIDRIIRAEGHHISDTDSYLAMIMQKSTDLDRCPNEYYGRHFNFSDVFNRQVIDDVAHDKMKDWRSRYFWDFFQIVVRNAHGIFCESEKIDFWDFSENLANSLLEYSISH